GMEKPRHRAAAEQWRERVKQPRTVDGESREQCRDEEDCDAPMKNARVDGMSQQLVIVDDGAASGANAPAGALVDASDRAAHLGSSRGGRPGPPELREGGPGPPE